MREYRSTMKKINEEPKIVTDGFEISKEFEYFEATSNRSEKLEKLYRTLLTTKATIVQLERAFSITGFFNTKIRIKPIPDTWSPMEDEELIKIVPVTNGSEYDDIQATFRRNLPSYRIIKIERIQNKALYHGYQALKRKYEAENPNITNEVDGLWHGTAEGAVDGINKSGFNRSYCSKNGSYGEGVYFARDIQYSADDNYSPPDHHKIKRIYQCSVLVGRMIQGHPGLKVLQDPYNSAVNNIQRPFIYVTFDDSQAYPNYLITFSN
ncbi:protein mono-ADP-ribosyltransferase PARP14-like [Octopus vulgaris]|uniref:Poly [ADP-ribose] polymerase n=1 Tax=Octopus vulgaris TaxID=6645 RepID=A0AA36AG89_OCTVU|nr:protein mono-ADP-ribosyltransferase PARP14-like [Octopus vulgaris]